MGETEVILIDFGPICRFCLHKTESDITIFSNLSQEITDDSIGSFVTALTSVEVDEKDNLPLQVCLKCFDKVNAILEFILQVKQSDIGLKDCFQRTLNEAKAKLIEQSCTELIIKEEDDDSKRKQTCIKKSKRGRGKDLSGRLKEAEIKLESDQLRSEELAKEFISQFCVKTEPDEVKNCEVKEEASEVLIFQCGHQVAEGGGLESCPDCDISNARKSKVSQRGQGHPRRSKAGGQIQCSECPSRFHTELQLTRHMRSRHAAKELPMTFHADLFQVFVCGDCPSSKCFRHITLLIKHQMEAHGKSLDDMAPKDLSPLHINTLDVFEDVQGWGAHSESTAPCFKALCRDCAPEVTLASPAELLLHMQLVHERTVVLKVGGHVSERLFVCEEPNCSVAFAHKRNLQRHYLLHHNKKLTTLSLTCPEPGCSQVSLSNKALIRHGLTEHGKYFAHEHNTYQKIILNEEDEVDTRQRDFECELCQKRFLTKSVLRKHLFRCHLEDGDARPSVASVCMYCGKVFSRAEKLKSHIEFVHEVLKVSCPVCHKKYNYKSIGRHYKRHSGRRPKAKTEFLCNHCGKVLYTKSNFESHQKSHLNIREHVCDVCGGRYTSHKGLQMHKVIHLGDARRMHPCGQCGKTFRGKQTLSRHLLTHSGVKDFVCELCSKPFYTMQELNRHIRGHNKVFRYSCDLCDMQFLERSRYRTHLMRHKNVRPHKCLFCDKLFIMRRNMNLHMASRHKYQAPGAPARGKDPTTYVPLEHLLKL